MASYADEWADYATVADITDAADAKNVVRFMKEEPGSGSGGRGVGATSAVADALTAAGLTLTSEQRATVSTAMTAVNAGEKRRQCTCVQTVLILYLGRVGTGEDILRLEPQLVLVVLRNRLHSPHSDDGAVPSSR